MSITARRSRRAAVAGLAIYTALAAPTFAANAGAAIAPVVLPPPPVGAVLKKQADLVVSMTTPTTIRVANVGRAAAGPFSIAVSAGDVGKPCAEAIPPVRKDLAALAVGQTKSFAVPESFTDRTVTVDYLNQVAEANELNNTGTVPLEPLRCIE